MTPAYASPGDHDDRLTAAPDAVPRRDPKVLSLADCWRMFVRQRTPPLLGAVIALAVVLRVSLGWFDWRDAVMVAGVVAVTPPVEWLIHVYFLHARPVRVL